MTTLSISKAWEETKRCPCPRRPAHRRRGAGAVLLPQAIAGVVAAAAAICRARRPPSWMPVLSLIVALAGLVGQIAVIRLALGPATSVGGGDHSRPQAPASGVRSDPAVRGPAGARPVDCPGRDHRTGQARGACWPGNARPGHRPDHPDLSSSSSFAACVSVPDDRAGGHGRGRRPAAYHPPQLGAERGALLAAAGLPGAGGPGRPRGPADRADCRRHLRPGRVRRRPSRSRFQRWSSR